MSKVLSRPVPGSRDGQPLNNKLHLLTGWSVGTRGSGTETSSAHSQTKKWKFKHVVSAAALLSSQRLLRPAEQKQNVVLPDTLNLAEISSQQQSCRSKRFYSFMNQVRMIKGGSTLKPGGRPPFDRDPWLVIGPVCVTGVRQSAPSKQETTHTAHVTILGLIFHTF